MKLLIVLALGTSLALAQAKAPVTQQGEDCTVNTNGSNNTVSLVCNNVDPKLAGQISAILKEAKRNERATKEFSEKLEQVLKQMNKTREMGNVQGAGSALSFNQQGGITAGTVNLGTHPAPNLKWDVDKDQPQPKDAKHPIAFAQLSIDQPFDDAKFAIFCDRPCKARGFSTSGFNYNCSGTFPGFPDTVAGFDVLQPNPMPPRMMAWLSVESKDDRPVRIVDIKLVTTDTPGNCGTIRP